jgi:hypothetical protein
METYDRNARGRVVVNFPYRNATFYEMTRAANLGDFIVEPRPQRKVGLRIKKGKERTAKCE